VPIESVKCQLHCLGILFWTLYIVKVCEWHRASETDSTSVFIYAELKRRSILLDDPLSRDQTLSFNRMQSRVVTGFLTRHNAVRKYLCITGLTVGGVGQRKKPQLMLCVGLKLWPHLLILTWIPFSRTLRMLEI
jgi:hypothetical protein